MAKKAIDMNALNSFVSGGNVQATPAKTVKEEPKPKQKKKVQKEEPELPIEQEELKQTNLRLYPSQLKFVDRLRKYRKRKTSRNTWLMEAIEEKIQRERKKYNI